MLAVGAAWWSWVMAVCMSEALRIRPRRIAPGWWVSGLGDAVFEVVGLGDRVDFGGVCEHRSKHGADERVFFDDQYVNSHPASSHWVW